MLNIQIKRNRLSVTQGSTDVYINGKKILNFGDDMYLKQKDGAFTNGYTTLDKAQHYGEVLSGWGSITPDSEFIQGLLYHPYDNVYHYSDIVNQAILESGNSIIEVIKEWFRYNYTLNYEEYSCSKVELVGENTFRLIIPCSGEIKEMEIPATEAEFMKFKKQHEREDDEYDI